MRLIRKKEALRHIIIPLLEKQCSNINGKWVFLPLEILSKMGIKRKLGIRVNYSYVVLLCGKGKRLTRRSVNWFFFGEAVVTDRKRIDPKQLGRLYSQGKLLIPLKFTDEVKLKEFFKGKRKYTVFKVGKYKRYPQRVQFKKIVK